MNDALINSVPLLTVPATCECSHTKGVQPTSSYLALLLHNKFCPLSLCHNNTNDRSSIVMSTLVLNDTLMLVASLDHQPSLLFPRITTQMVHSWEPSRRPLIDFVEGRTEDMPRLFAWRLALFVGTILPLSRTFLRWAAPTYWSCLLHFGTKLSQHVMMKPPQVI